MIITKRSAKRKAANACILHQVLSSCQLRMFQRAVEDMGQLDPVLPCFDGILRLLSSVSYQKEPHTMAITSPIILFDISMVLQQL